MRVIFYRSSKRENSKKQAPIYCRITIAGKRAEIATGIFCTAEKWSSRRSRIKASTEKEELENEALNRMEATLFRAKADIETGTGLIDADLIKKLVKAKAKNPLSGIALMTLVDMYLAERDTDVKIKHLRNSTYGVYKSRRTALINYLELINDRHIMASSIRESFAETMQQKLSAQGLKHSYINALIEFARCALEFGVRKKLIQMNELKFFQIKRGKHKKLLPLPEAKVAELINYRSKWVNREFMRDRFLLQTFTGVAYVDIKKLYDPNNIKEIYGVQFFSFNRHKSNSPALIEVLPEALEILRKHNFQYKRVAYETYRRGLKRIAKDLGWDVNLTSHMGRRTFGQIMVNLGYSTDAVAHMLGDTPEVARKHYVTVGIERILFERNELKKRDNQLVG